MTLKEKTKNKPIKVGIQMDSLDKINKKTDSTLALIEEALKRGFIVYIYTVENLSIIGNKPVCEANQVLSVNILKEKFLILDKKKRIYLKNLHYILIRQDPPFDMQYITATHILDKLPESCIIINKPDSFFMC